MSPLTGTEQKAINEHLELLHRVCLDQARRIQAVEDFLRVHPSTASEFHKVQHGMTTAETESVLEKGRQALEKALSGNPFA